MYDRRIEGREYVFGNQGALYLNAMTWWDHETQSVWSQVTGEALYGPLRGTRLRLIPAAVETWSAWLAGHPATRVLETPEGFFPEVPTDDFVIGVRIADASVAFAFPYVVRQGVVNDEVGGEPVAVHARPDHLIRVFSREVAGRVVTLTLDGERLVDPATGTAWDPATGQGVAGPLARHPLAPVAWISSFDWAWRQFYPDARFVGTGGSSPRSATLVRLSRSVGPP